MTDSIKSFDKIQKTSSAGFPWSTSLVILSKKETKLAKQDFPLMKLNSRDSELCRTGIRLLEGILREQQDFRKQKQKWDSSFLILPPLKTCFSSPAPMAYRTFIPQPSPSRITSSIRQKAILPLFAAYSSADTKEKSEGE